MLKTCVILCGGYGSRLKDLTKKKPKPMVIVAGKPFLEHLLVQLRDQGITNVILLIGYKGQMIKNYFKDGKKWSLNIKYSFNQPNFYTGYRLNSAKGLIKNNFLLMYSDNYCPFNLKKNYKIFLKQKTMVTLLISKKKSGNVNLNKKNHTNYSIKRNKKNKFVEIGYMIIDRKFLNVLSNKNISLSHYLSEASYSKKISSIETFNKYLSISDPDRLKETRSFFKKKNIILIDRDGVLNKKNPNFFYVRNLNELKFNYKVINVLKKFPKLKYICITNQAGISTKEIKPNNLIKINNYIKNKLKSENINILDFYVSEHHYQSNHFDRKPNPGNFLKAANKYKLLLDKTFYIGDDPRDVLASYNANTKCVYLGDKKKLSTLKKLEINEIIIEDLNKAIFKMGNSIY